MVYIFKLLKNLLLLLKSFAVTRNAITIEIDNLSLEAERAQTTGPES